MQSAGAQTASPEQVREVLDRVLSGADFRDQQNPIMEAVGDFFTWFFGLFKQLGLDPSVGTLEAGIKLIWIGILISTSVFLAWVLVRQVQNLRARPARLGSDLPDEVALRVEELRRQASAAESQGDLTLALRLYFFALVIGLGQRGELEYSPAWTNRELLERGEPRQEVAHLLRPLVGELDAHSFGEEPTQPCEVKRFADLCERLLGGRAA